jgi:transcriptional regulator with PAS, ATPase and Fis domain
MNGHILAVNVIRQFRLLLLFLSPSLPTKAMPRQSTPKKIGVLSPQTYVPNQFEGMLGVSLPMLEVFQRIVDAASADIPVLITGETGTGKDLVAGAIHNRSRRKDKPFVAVNMGAMSAELIASELFGHKKGAYTGAIGMRKGSFEQANGGTIFLDEISTMDEKCQVSLLRVLETKMFRRVGGEKGIPVDVRVIAATNEDLEEAIKKNRFREDLYYRFDVFRIHLPPLRERSGGLTALTHYFLAEFGRMYNKNLRAVSAEALRCLESYSWPGNVRELKNVIQRAVLVAKGEELTPELLPTRIRNAGKSDRESLLASFPIHVGMTLEAAEKEFVAMTLASAAGNKKKAASILGISRRALYDKLKRHKLL